MTEQNNDTISWSKCRDEIEARFTNLIDLFEALHNQIQSNLDALELLTLQDDEKILAICEEIDTVLSKFPRKLIGGVEGYCLQKEEWSIDEFGKNYTKMSYEALLANIARSQIKQSKYTLSTDEALEALPPETESPTQEFKKILDNITGSFNSVINKESKEEEEKEEEED